MTAAARAAAFEDPRFHRLSTSELAIIRIEVSLLSALEPMAAFSEAEALRNIRPHVDGLLLELGRHRGIFLPQVWGSAPDARDFLGLLKLKAGLPPDFWSNEIRLYRFQSRQMQRARNRADGALMHERYPAHYWHKTADGRIQCDVCPRDCKLREGQRGACFVRMRESDEMVLTTYGRSSGFCIDPIEKKPLNHFYPGTGVLSFGTAGCRLGCKFCQNWSTSKTRKRLTG